MSDNHYPVTREPGQSDKSPALVVLTGQHVGLQKTYTKI